LKLTAIIEGEGNGFGSLCPELDVASQGDTLTVPVPDHKEIRIGTLLSIIRLPGVPRSNFEV